MTAEFATREQIDNEINRLDRLYPTGSRLLDAISQGRFLVIESTDGTIAIREGNVDVTEPPRDVAFAVWFRERSWADVAARRAAKAPTTIDPLDQRAYDTLGEMAGAFRISKHYATSPAQDEALERLHYAFFKANPRHVSMLTTYLQGLLYHNGIRRRDESSGLEILIEAINQIVRFQPTPSTAICGAYADHPEIGPPGCTKPHGHDDNHGEANNAR